MNPANMHEALRIADQEAQRAGLDSGFVRQQAIQWLKAHRTRQQLIDGIAALLAKLGSLPRG